MNVHWNKPVQFESRKDCISASHITLHAKFRNLTNKNQNASFKRAQLQGTLFSYLIYDKLHRYFGKFERPI